MGSKSTDKIDLSVDISRISIDTRNEIVNNHQQFLATPPQVDSVESEPPLPQLPPKDAKAIKLMHQWVDDHYPDDGVDRSWWWSQWCSLLLDELRQSFLESPSYYDHSEAHGPLIFFERLEVLSKCYAKKLDKIPRKMPEKCRKRVLNWIRHNRVMWSSTEALANDFRSFFLPHRRLSNVDYAMKQSYKNFTDIGKKFVADMHNTFDHLVDKKTIRTQKILPVSSTSSKSTTKTTAFNPAKSCWACGQRGHSRDDCQNEALPLRLNDGTSSITLRSCPKDPAHQSALSLFQQLLFEEHYKKRCIITVMIYGKALNCLVDTGACKSFVSRKISAICRLNNAKTNPTNTSVQLADGTPYTFDTELEISIFYLTKEHTVNLLIFDELRDDVILGMDMLTKLGLKITLAGEDLPIGQFEPAKINSVSLPDA